LQSLAYLDWDCTHTMQSRVYATVGCPSVCSSAAAGLLLWARPAGDIDRLLHGAQQRGRRMRVVPRYDTRCYFNVHSKADTSQLNLLHGTKN